MRKFCLLSKAFFMKGIHNFFYWTNVMFFPQEFKDFFDSLSSIGTCKKYFFTPSEF